MNEGLKGSLGISLTPQWYTAAAKSMTLLLFFCTGSSYSDAGGEQSSSSSSDTCPTFTVLLQRHCPPHKMTLLFLSSGTVAGTVWGQEGGLGWTTLSVVSTNQHPTSQAWTASFCFDTKTSALVIVSLLSLTGSVCFVHCWAMTFILWQLLSAQTGFITDDLLFFFSFSDQSRTLDVKLHVGEAVVSFTNISFIVVSIN